MALPASEIPSEASARSVRGTLRLVTGGGGGDVPVAGGPLLPGGNGVLGMAIFVAAETMLFAGLVSALLILRAGAEAWPPPGQPRLPVGITLANTLILLASGATMARAAAASARRRRGSLVRSLAATWTLGALFLVVQGLEWVRLMRFGLSASQTTYGGLFYAVVGCHGAHVVAAVAALLVVLARQVRGRASHAEIEVTRIYWLFVVAVWPVLYLLVYLL